MTIDEFLTKLQKPQYVYTMAKANHDSLVPGMGKSAKTRMKNAKREIQELVTTYALSMEREDD